MKKSPKKKGKSVTTEELAVMVQKGFTALDSKIDSNHTELKDYIKEMQENIEDSTTRHIKTFRHDYDDLAYRVKKLEHKVFEKR